jgi:DnaJ like chaperone protein
MQNPRITGKVVGAVLGFVVGGGFLGCLIGLVLGHIHDVFPPPVPLYQRRDRYPSQAEQHGFVDSLQQSTFTIGVIVLGAKMAKSDGRVSREEISTFRRVFHIAEADAVEVGRVFDEARQTASGYEPYAARLAQVFRRNPGVLEEILTGLFLVAIADRTGLSLAKVVFLRRVAVIFGFGEEDFARIAARSGVRLPGQPSSGRRDDSYAVLGLGENASVAEIKRTYHVLIRKHHPDKLASQGLPPELMAQATEKMKRINAAYSALCKARGIK